MRDSYLHMKTGESNPLCELVGRLPINHLRMPGAEERRFDEQLKSEFPFSDRGAYFRQWTRLVAPRGAGLPSVDHTTRWIVASRY